MSLKIELFKKLLLISMSFTLIAGSFIAYDCAHQLANITRINMIEPSECKIPSEPPVVSQVEVVLVQSVSDYPVHVYQCKVSVERIIVHCGTFSDSLVSGGFTEYITDTSSDECRDMHMYKTTKLLGQHVIHGLESNNSKVFPVVLSGGVDNDGKCSGGSYSDRFGSWSNVYVMSKVTISLKDSVQQVNNEDQKIRLPSGHTCSVSEPHCIDPEDGFSMWQDSENKDCEHINFELLYEGKVNKSIIPLQGTKSILFTSNSETSFSLMATTHTTVCGHKAFQTEHPKLKIIETNGMRFKFQGSKNVFNLDLFTYMNSKFTYVERHIQSQLNNLHKSILMNQCRIEKSLLSTQLSIASLSPSEFAYLRIGKPGYTAMVAGEVIYLVKCQAVSVIKANTNDCYLEFPIVYKNQTFFMTPKTRLIQSKGTQVPCSDIIPINYQIDGNWYSFSPSAHPVSPPESLVPKSEGDWVYVQPANLITSGIYSEEDIEKLRKQLMFPLEKGAALSSLASTVNGFNFGHQNFNYDSLTSDSTISTALDRYFSKASGIFGWLGQSFSVVIGLWFSFKLIKFLFDSTIHGWALYKKYGCDPRVGAMFWDALTTHFLSRPVNKSTSVSPSVNESHELQHVASAPAIESVPLMHNPPHVRITVSNFLTKNLFHVCVRDKSRFIVMFSGVQIIKEDESRIDIANVDVIGEEGCSCGEPMYSPYPASSKP